MDELGRILVVADDLSDGNVMALLDSHRQEMLKHSPAENVHALDTNQLRADHIKFWSASLITSQGKEFAGCGALKDLGNGHGELKSMKTEPNHLRKGVAQTLLAHILNEAKKRGFKRISLETGTQSVFEAARQLYTRNGFIECAPFADYPDVDISVCMTKEL